MLETPLEAEAADPGTTPQRLRELVSQGLGPVVASNPNVDVPLLRELWLRFPVEASSNPALPLLAAAAPGDLALQGMLRLSPEARADGEPFLELLRRRSKFGSWSDYSGPWGPGPSVSELDALWGMSAAADTIDLQARMFNSWGFACRFALLGGVAEHPALPPPVMERAGLLFFRSLDELREDLPHLKRVNGDCWLEQVVGAFARSPSITHGVGARLCDLLLGEACADLLRWLSVDELLVSLLQNPRAPFPVLARCLLPPAGSEVTRSAAREQIEERASWGDLDARLHLERAR